MSDVQILDIAIGLFILAAINFRNAAVESKSGNVRDARMLRWVCGGSVVLGVFLALLAVGPGFKLPY